MVQYTVHSFIIEIEKKYNLITDKTLSVENELELYRYSNYITLKEDNKLNYYNTDLKLIYTK